MQREMKQPRNGKIRDKSRKHTGGWTDTVEPALRQVTNVVKYSENMQMIRHRRIQLDNHRGGKEIQNKTRN